MQSDNPRAIKAREERAFYVSIGLCPRCGKSRLFGEEKTCPECRAKSAEYQKKWRERNLDECNQKHNAYYRSLYQQRKEAGMCTRCGKRKALHNTLLCGICKDRRRIYREEKRVQNEKLTRNERLEHGLCYFCGAAPLPGFKTCEKHHKVFAKNADKSRQKYKERIENYGKTAVN